MSVNEVTYYQVQCDECGTNETGSDYSAWADEGGAVDDAVFHGWHAKWTVIRTIPPTEKYPHERQVMAATTLLCPACQKCEVCGESAYEVNEHLVCEDHEDHEFGEVSGE